MANKTSSFLDNSPPKVDQIWLNMVTGEVANAIPMAGDSVDATGLVNDQLLKSIKSYVSQAGILCTDTSSGANVYVVNASTPFTNPVLKIGTRVRFKTANANTSSSTITAFGGSAITCKKSDGSTNLSSGDILANSEVEFVYNGTNWVRTLYGAIATTTNQGVAYLNNPIKIVNDGSSPNDTVGFIGGTFITSSGSVVLLPTMTKKIQSSGAWTAGTGQNGLDTGARTASTFYRTYVIQNNSTLAYDILFSPSATSPTVPSGYTNLGIIDYAIIRVNASTNIATANWDVNDKRLVLGAGESIQVFSGTATGAGNTTILNTIETLEFVVRLYLSTASAGGSDISVYGSEQSSSDIHECISAGTNNGFQAMGGGSVYTTDGKIYWKNFSTAGGVSNQTCKIKSIKIRS